MLGKRDVTLPVCPTAFSHTRNPEEICQEERVWKALIGALVHLAVKSSPGAQIYLACKLEEHDNQVFFLVLKCCRYRLQHGLTVQTEEKPATDHAVHKLVDMEYWAHASLQNQARGHRKESLWVMANGNQVSSWDDITCSKAHCGDGYTTLGFYLNLFKGVSYGMLVTWK